TPMPNASERTATKLNPVFLDSIRIPYRKSWPICSSQIQPQVPRVCSLRKVGLPKARMAAERASWGLMPEATFSAICCSRWNWISSSNRCVLRPRWKRVCNRSQIRSEERRVGKERRDQLAADHEEREE